MKHLSLTPLQLSFYFLLGHERKAHPDVGLTLDVSVPGSPVCPARLDEERLCVLIHEGIARDVGIGKAVTRARVAIDYDVPAQSIGQVLREAVRYARGAGVEDHPTIACRSTDDRGCQLVEVLLGDVRGR